MYKKLLSLCLLVILSVPAGLAGGIEADDRDGLRENARELLVETSVMALNLRSPSNRIGFSIRTANLLWELDETAARVMFEASIENVRELLGRIDLETNQFESLRTGRRTPPDLRTRTNQAFALRSALISALSNHDPERALEFVRETGRMMTNPALLKKIERDDKRAEARIARKIAEKDVTKALEMGREKLSAGIDPDVVGLLGRIYEKDREKGREFAGEILRKVPSAGSGGKNTWLIVRLFEYGLAKSSAEVPLFDEAGLRVLAAQVAARVSDPKSRYRSLPTELMEALRRYAPDGAARVERAFLERSESPNGRRGRANGTNGSNGPGRPPEAGTDPVQATAVDYARLQTGTLSAEERRERLEAIRRRVLAEPDGAKRFKGLVELAGAAVAAGESEIARSVLGEAEQNIERAPRLRVDFLNSRNLASAYAPVDPDRSFLIMEDMVYRLNEVIEAYIIYNRYHGSGRVVENDEMIFNGRTRQFTNHFKVSSSAIRDLAAADYERLKNLSDKFGRPEMRVAMRLVIAEGLLRAGTLKIAPADKQAGVGDE